MAICPFLHLRFAPDFDLSHGYYRKHEWPNYHDQDVVMGLLVEQTLQQAPMVVAQPFPAMKGQNRQPAQSLLLEWLAQIWPNVRYQYETLAQGRQTQG